MRLFVAISLPEALKDELYQNTVAIQKNCFKPYQHHLLRWTSKEQFHITQYFLGSVEETLLPTVKEAIIKSIQAVSSFNLSVEKICWFPEESPSPKMLWLKFFEHKAFSALSENIYNSLSTLIPNLEKPRNPITPHVTLIRLKKIKPYNRDLNQFRSIEIRVIQVELWQSFLDEKGAKYKTIEVFPLNLNKFL